MTDNATTLILTEGERKVLNMIVDSEYHDGGDIIDNPVWSVCESNEDKGYLGSLVKKGLAGVDNTVKGSETCWITAKGFEAINNK